VGRWLQRRQRPLGAGGLDAPWLAGLGMAASSLLVIGNAMRLARALPPLSHTSTR